jgi:hypothetical protein
MSHSRHVRENVEGYARDLQKWWGECDECSRPASDIVTLGRAEGLANAGTPYERQFCARHAAAAMRRRGIVLGLDRRPVEQPPYDGREGVRRTRLRTTVPNIDEAKAAVLVAADKIDAMPSSEAIHHGQRTKRHGVEADAVKEARLVAA